MKKHILFSVFFISYQVHAGWFDDSEKYINQCVDMYKDKNHIDFFIKAIDIEKIDDNKYEYTPVMVLRGEETAHTRQYCEHYPDEEMIYTGVAQSVIEQRKKDEVKRLKQQLILKQKENERVAAEEKHQAELRALKEKARAEELAKVQADKERSSIENRAAKERKRKEQLEERERILAEFSPLIPLCINKDHSRLVREMNERSPGFNGNLVAKEIKSTNFSVAGEYLIVRYSYYSYDQKKHERWRQQNGPTAGRLFHKKTEASCLISELKTTKAML